MIFPKKDLYTVLLFFIFKVLLNNLITFLTTIFISLETLFLFDLIIMSKKIRIMFKNLF